MLTLGLGLVAGWYIHRFAAPIKGWLTRTEKKLEGKLNDHNND